MLFASMGTTDPNLTKDHHSGYHGYEWQPWKDKEMRQKLYDLKAVEGGDPEGNPHGLFEENYPSGCGWLKHRLLTITGNLGPVTQHYQPPTIKDAPGYDENYQYWMDGQTKYKAKLDRLKNDTEYLNRLHQKYPSPIEVMNLAMKWSKKAFFCYDRDIDYERYYEDSDSNDSM